ncbi:ATP-dependent zinc protease [Vreelandella populi]|uniref:ATP-dependent zinc protease n=1 Tax=Vreelandella populi TaxID=2498858 RepID=A0A433L8H4_9GAMM|nr:ATP-dependent zinc protease [Halomonas populi]RUR38452.1 ATP-dependent zinc protease [Halomonas populi]RUR43508.1 ATP-dependent zinc protease [Halomonas populi]RUR51603.1 ATP-dependent zinc protease [Halomonas populi]
MRPGVLWLMAGLSLLFSGCALQQPEPNEPPPLSEASFNTRILELQNTLSQQCGAQTLQQEQLLHQQHALTADVREVGSLLRLLRSDVQDLEARGEEPIIIREECEVDNALETKTIVGRSEWIGLPGIGTYLKARVDSGANTSSLSASDITRFERDGEDWVRFKLALNEDDVVVESLRDEWIEAPVERRVRIVQASGEATRPVISLLMTLGPIRQNVQFTLNDRTHLDFPVLLGRRFMMDIAVIDVAQAYIHERPEFPGGEPAEQAAEDEVADQDDNEE